MGNARDLSAETMSTTLSNARHEAFALNIANGHKLERAHELAGFKPDCKTAWSLRHRPDISRRIEELLKDRVQAATRRRVRREKKEEDLRERVIEELRRIAFADVRDVMKWNREPVMSPDGEVLDVIDRITVTASDKLTDSSAAAIKSVFQKAGTLRVELHDKRAALEALARILKGDGGQPTGGVHVTQVNVGQMNALELAQRVHFLLAAAAHRAPAPKTIDGEVTKDGDHETQLMDGGTRAHG
jgi:phage terminase small subunit